MTPKQTVPALFTMGNLCFGITAIIFAFQGEINTAAWFILAAAFLDGVDGRVARRLEVAGDLGKQLDSLADLVSFGIAPGLLAWMMQLSNLGLVGYAFVLFFAVCGAYRLARFNIKQFSGAFEGVPITIAGGLVALSTFWGQQVPVWFYPLFLLSLGYLMVSKIRVPKF